MKKSLALIVALSMAFSLSACGNSNKNIKNTSASTKSTKNKDSNEIAVDQGLLNVTITLPASMFEGQSDFDPKKYNEEQGFKETVVNQDGSISITMSKSKHKDLLSDMQSDIDKTFSNLIEGADTPYIKNITYDKNFSTVTVEVEKVGYEATTLEMTPLLIGLSASIYQQYNGTEPHCEILIKDASSGDTLKTIPFPDTLNKK